MYIMYDMFSWWPFSSGEECFGTQTTQLFSIRRRLSFGSLNTNLKGGWVDKTFCPLFPIIGENEGTAEGSGLRAHLQGGRAYVSGPATHGTVNRM
jgi:hypothetical protein